MKLHPDYITHKADDETLMLATGESSRHFNGLVRSNATAAYIIELLKKDTDETAIVDAVCEKYDAPRETIVHDVAEILEKLRSIGALCE
jgi:methyltransferase-like protein